YVGSGGALENDLGSSATVLGSQFLRNRAIGGGSQSGQGGAIANYDLSGSGTALKIMDSTFTGNQGLGGLDGGEGSGGAIDSSADATFTGSTFESNSAIGGNGGVLQNSNFEAGIANGGAIRAYGGATVSVIVIAQCAFLGNQSIAGSY